MFIRDGMSDWEIKSEVMEDTMKDLSKDSKIINKKKEEIKKQIDQFEYHLNSLTNRGSKSLVDCVDSGDWKDVAYYANKIVELQDQLDALNDFLKNGLFALEVFRNFDSKLNEVLSKKSE